MDDNYILFLLNTLGQAYILSSSKFDENNEVLVNTKDLNFVKLIKGTDNKDYKILDDNIVHFTVQFLNTKAKIIINYKIVLLEYSKKRSIINPDTIYKWYNDRYTYLNYKRYIIINEPYSKITISSKSKGSSINIEDILIASCNMALDENSYILNIEYGGYKRIESTIKDTMILRPGFDNFL